MSDNKQKFSANYAKDAVFKTGLRDFMEYRDLGISDATHGQVHAHLIRVKPGQEGDQDMHSTGAHQHLVDFQFFYVVKGWIKFVYEGQGGEMTFNAGDCVLQPSTIRHNELACSEDLEVLEIYSPAIHETRSVEEVPGHVAA